MDEIRRVDERLRRVAVVIPALDPDVELVAVVRELVGLGFGRVLVVDDGSSGASAVVFAQVAGLAEVLSLPVQRGKGAALKAGFRRLLEGGEVWEAVVTADADGQHRPADVARVGAVSSNGLVLGTRAMGEGVPWKSRLGNGMTRWAFRAVTGRPLRDTQTGLRRIPWALLAELLKVPGERYEYELAMLLRCCEPGMDVREVEIATVYEDGNAGTHFRAVSDSVRVWAVLGRWWWKRSLRG